MRRTTGAHGPVGDALTALRSGRPVLVLDDEDRENEGDLVVAAEFADAASVNLMIKEGGGLICVAVSPELVERLDLRQMVSENDDSHGTAFTVSVDARCTGTGISAADRAATIRSLADPGTRPHDLRRPGHVFPLRAAPGGVMVRRGHTEAAVELATMAGLTPAAAICEVLDGNGGAADNAYLSALAERLGIPMLSIADIAHEVAHASAAGRADTATATIPNRHGRWTATAFAGIDGVEHLALVLGEPGASPAPLVRVHSECLTGDVLGSRRCDCGEQLDCAMAAIARAGCGVVVYLRGHEGRGIGLLDKIRAYALQEQGCDTVEADIRLGLPVDARDYADAAAFLRGLGVVAVRLLSNSVAKAGVLRDCGVSVLAMVPVQPPEHPENEHHLNTERRRLGHLPAARAEGVQVIPGTDHIRSTEGHRAC